MKGIGSFGRSEGSKCRPGQIYINCFRTLIRLKRKGLTRRGISSSFTSMKTVIKYATRGRGTGLSARTAIRASEYELDAWRQAARNAGQSLSSWMADQANKGLSKEESK